MGLYSTLITRMPCARCGAERPEYPVQFKTGDETGLPTYREGDRVPALAADSPYEAIGAAYCSECAARLEEEIIEVAARAVAGGEVIARHYESAPKLAPHGDPLGGEQVGRALRAQEAPPHCTLSLPNRLEGAGVALYRGEERIFPLYDDASMAALRWWQDYLYEDLLTKGWPFGFWDSREDIAVVVDSRGEIRLEMVRA